MANYYPENAAELDQAVFDWVRGATDSDIPVVWAKQRASDGSSPPMPTKPFVLLSLLVPPIQDGQAEHRAGQALRIVDVEPATAYDFTIAGTEFSYTSGSPSTTLGAIQEDLVDLINDEDIGVTAFAHDSEYVAIVAGAGKEDGPIITVEDEDLLRPKLMRYVLVDGLATYSIDVFSDDRSAPAIAKGIELALDHDTVRDALHVGGWSTSTIQGTRKPDTVVGSAWEHRAGFDTILRCRMRSLNILDFIEEMELGVGLVGTVEAGA